MFKCASAVPAGLETAGCGAADDADFAWQIGELHPMAISAMTNCRKVMPEPLPEPTVAERENVRLDIRHQ